MKTLYDYQSKALRQIIKAIYVIGRALMVMAPGLGKTVVSSFFLKKVYKPGYKVLFLCHDKYILKQANEEYRSSFDPKHKLKFYNFFGAIKCVKAAKEADVVFGSFQSLNHRKSKWFYEFAKDHFEIIIVDEGHHVLAPTFKEIVEYFAPKFSLCMTGTPDRTDNLNIRLLYGNEVVYITIEEGIAKGWLTPVEYHVLSDGLKQDALKKLFQEVTHEKRRVTLNQINKMLFIKKRDKEQIKEIKKYTKNWKKKCIIFCESIHHVRSFAKKLEKDTYVTFHSHNTEKVNNQNLDMFRNGKATVILSVNKFNEGIDVPDAEVIVFLRLTESGVIYRQQLGRGLRKKFGKKKVIVLDFVANANRILMIQGMIQQVQQFEKPTKADKSLLSVSGTNYSFDFADELTDVIEILRVARMGKYETWQAASRAAIALGIKTLKEYSHRYKEDRQLPSSPTQFYTDFPGPRIFFDTQFYPTWQEAAAVTRKLGIRTTDEYNIRCKEDPRLPSTVFSYYPDFPGWEIFSGRFEAFDSAGPAEQKRLLKAELEKHGVTDYYSLMKFGSKRFNKVTFGEYGSSQTFLRKALGRSFNKSGVRNADLEELAGKLNWKFRSADQEFLRLKSELTKRGIIDYNSLFEYGTERFKSVTFGEYGKGSAFLAKLLGESIGIVNERAFKKTTAFLKWPKPTSVELLEYYKRLLKNHGITDYYSLVRCGPIKLQKLSFGNIGMGISFFTKVLGKNHNGVGVNWERLEQLAKKLGWKRDSKREMTQWKSELAKNGITDYISLMEFGSVRFKKISFEDYEGPGSFITAIIGLSSTSRQNYVTHATMKAMARKLGWKRPVIVIKKEPLDRLKKELRKHGIINYSILAKFGCVKFKRAQFGTYGPGGDFIAKLTDNKFVGNAMVTPAAFKCVAKKLHWTTKGINEKGTYSSCRQASKVARSLGVRTQADYAKKRKRDPLLPSMPNEIYKDFPGWHKFLGKKKRIPYESLKLASKAAKKLKISSFAQYVKNYKKDDKLPSNPDLVYHNWRGWIKFLGKK